LGIKTHRKKKKTPRPQDKNFLGKKLVLACWRAGSFFGVSFVASFVLLMRCNGSIFADARE
jgi:hypothetical protein